MRVYVAKRWHTEDRPEDVEVRVFLEKEAAKQWAAATVDFRFLQDAVWEKGLMKRLEAEGLSYAAYDPEAPTPVGCFGEVWPQEL